MIRLTQKDIKKPLRINNQDLKEESRAEDIAQLLEDITKHPEKIIDIVVTDTYFNININH